MNEITVRVNAKINLTLDVIGKYKEVYHELDTVMASVGIFDIVTCKIAKEVSVIMDDKVSDNDNTAYKAVVMCMERFGISALSVNIRKGIPFSAGMGGSSADSAAVLYCVRKMFDIDYCDIAEVAKLLGSDVVYMLNGGFMRAGGKGDDLTPLPYYNYSLVVVRPNKGVNTAQVFNEFDKNEIHSDFTQKFVGSDDGNIAKQHIGNALQNSASTLNLGIGRVIKELRKYSEYVAMTGSGSSVYAIMDNMDDANTLADSIANKYFFVKACTTLRYGIKEI